MDDHGYVGRHLKMSDCWDLAVPEGAGSRLRTEGSAPPIKAHNSCLWKGPKSFSLGMIGCV